MKTIQLAFFGLLCLILSGFNSFSQQEFVLNEEYNNNYNSWTEQSEKEAKSKIRDGKYICDINSGIFFLDQLITVNLNSSRDFVIEATMTKKSGDVSYGITWGADGIGSRYNFVINSSGTYSIHKWTSYSVSFFANSISTYAIKSDYSPNKLTIKKQGNTLKFYVNDSYLQDLPFESFFGQKFGFYANSGKLEIEVENYKIYYTGNSNVNTYTTNTSKTQDFVLNEEYNNNYNSWTEQSEKEATSRIRDGKYICDISSGIFFLNQLITVNLDQTRDFVIESTMTKKSGDVSYGLTWGADGSGSRFNFVINSSGSYSLHKWTSYNVSFYANSISSYAIKGDYTPNKLSIKKEGRTLKFYVNDTYLQDLPFESFFGKKFGFYANSGDLKIEVENYKIYYTGSSNVNATTTTTSSGRTNVFVDYFDDNSKSWYEGDEKDIECKVKNGTYMIDYKSKESSYNFYQTVYLDQTRDYVIESNIYKVDGIQDYGFGITFGYKDPNNKYDFLISSNGLYSVTKWTAGDYTKAIAWASSSAVNQGNRVNNKLTIKKEGYSLKFYVNDTYVDQMSLPSFYGDRIGFIVNKNQYLEVRDLQIYYVGSAPTNITSNNSSVIPAKYTDIGILVYDFLETFDHSTTATHEYRKKFLAPSYMNSKGLYADKYKVNNYTIYGHSNESVNSSTGIVKTLIWGQDRGWIKKLNFTIVKENDYYYIYPASITSNDYIEPWSSIENDVTVSNTVKNDFEEGKKVVSGFLDAIKNGNNSTDIFMKSFLSPKYLLNGGCYDPKYKVNTYSLYGYEVESADASTGKVTAKIWGQDKGWIHRLYFIVVKEDGNYYLSPSKVSDSFYIYPWESVDTYVK